MSKFCENCGSELKDTDNVCPNCGAPVGKTTKKDVKVEKNSVEQSTTNQAKPNNGEGFFSNKKNLALVGGIAAAVLLLIIIIIALSSGGYKKPIDNMCKGMEKANSKTFLKAFPEVMKEDLEDRLDDDYLENQLEDFEEEYGKNIKISYKILDKEKIDKDDLEDIQDNLEKQYDDVAKKKVKVTAGYKLTVKMTIKGKDDKDTDSTTINVYKIGGKWCIAGASSSLF